MSATILFVHGSFMSGWCWLPVIERLEHLDVVCRAVELPFTSLNDDVDLLRAEIRCAKEIGPVIVVCHSYSGITTSIAAHDADQLVYVAARLPQPGESQHAISETWGTAEFRECISTDDAGVSTLDPSVDLLLFNRSPEWVARTAVDRLRPMRSEIPVEPLDDPAWTSVPSTYVVCTDDLVVSIEQQRFRASLVGRSIELDCDHSPFFSAPDDLAIALSNIVDMAVTR